MKAIFLATATLMAAAGVAEAKCSTAALDGQWIYFEGDKKFPETRVVTIKNGAFLETIDGWNVSLTMGSSCKGAVQAKQGGPTYGGKAASERIPKSSSLKPNMLTIYIKLDENNGDAFKLFRKSQG